MGEVPPKKALGRGKRALDLPQHKTKFNEVLHLQELREENRLHRQLVARYVDNNWAKLVGKLLEEKPYMADTKIICTTIRKMPLFKSDA